MKAKTAEKGDPASRVHNSGRRERCDQIDAATLRLVMEVVRDDSLARYPHLISGFGSDYPDSSDLLTQCLNRPLVASDKPGLK